MTDMADTPQTLINRVFSEFLSEYGFRGEFEYNPNLMVYEFWVFNSADKQIHFTMQSLLSAEAMSAIFTNYAFKYGLVEQSSTNE